MALGVSTEKVVTTQMTFKGFDLGGRFVASNRDEPFVLSAEDGRFLQIHEDREDGGYDTQIFVIPDDLMLALAEHFPDVIYCSKQENFASFVPLLGKLVIEKGGFIVLQAMTEEFSAISSETAASQFEN